MLLVIDSLSVRRGERTVLAEVSLRARAGTALLLTGANGSGKTTLLRAIAGLIRPSAGRVLLQAEGRHRTAAENGVPDDAGADDVAQRCHLIGHLNGHRAALTVAENATFWARYLGGDGRGVERALGHFRLAELMSVPTGYLSAGQKRRLGLARLLLAPRSVWLLDEPAVSLDAASRELLAGAVNAHLAGGGIVVAATHQPLGFDPAQEMRLGADAVGARASPAAADELP